MAQAELTYMDYSPSEEFVQKQMELMKQGKSEKEAFLAVKEKFDEDSARMM